MFPGHTRVAPPSLLRAKALRRRREGDDYNFAQSLHDRVAAFAMGADAARIQVILRQMHGGNQRDDQTEI